MYRPHDIIASGSHRKPMAIEVMSLNGMQPGLSRAQAASLTAVTVNGLMGLGAEPDETKQPLWPILAFAAVLGVVLWKKNLY
jgi:hypothetical protein